MTGLFGVVSKEDCAKTLFYGTDYHTHLGAGYGGLAIWSDKLYRSIHNISQAQFKSKFVDEYKEMKGNIGIGVISDRDVQPITLASQFGTFAIATAGLVENADELAQSLLKKGEAFAEVGEGVINTTELVGRLIVQSDSIVEGIEKALSSIKGSISLLILAEEGIYAARDERGRLPLVIGEREKDIAIASESCSFSNLGFKIKKYIQPGETILATKEGLKTKKGSSGEGKLCAFLWIYTGYPASSYEDVCVESVRERCGRALAKKDNFKADLVAGVPDSGTAHAIGYAMESKLPFRRPLVKYSPSWDRSYTPPSQEIRELVAKMKLIPIREIIDGNRIVLCEDSIVRGTQLKNLAIQKLWENGAKEIHLRPACPPLLYPCKFSLTTRTIQELVARRAIRAIEGKDIEDITEYLNPASKKYYQMVEWIRNELNVTTLRYQTLDDMVEAIGLPKDKLCLYCWCGEE
ncbi:MAG: amidophosphoribosyltransferase [Candidatus Thermoplasmatota archaeon]|nr:amidophosphoribosyltransferase [Candidatus Thermoplasmatota archaeon]